MRRRGVSEKLRQVSCEAIFLEPTFANRRTRKQGFGPLFASTGSRHRRGKLQDDACKSSNEARRYLDLDLLLF